MPDRDLQSWVAQQLPPIVNHRPPEVRQYTDELVLVLHVAPPAASEGEPSEAIQELTARLRNETRALRMKIAGELERTLGLPVAWGMRVGDLETLFTTRTVPVMTRLGRAERDVLDTLVAAGVADTRSSALAYTVRAFAAEHGAWLAEVREAIAEVDRVRSRLKIRPRKGAPKINVDDER
jgi:hypothetical protein